MSSVTSEPGAITGPFCGSGISELIAHVIDTAGIGMVHACTGINRGSLYNYREMKKATHSRRSSGSVEKLRMLSWVVHAGGGILRIVKSAGSDATSAAEMRDILARNIDVPETIRSLNDIRDENSPGSLPPNISRTTLYRWVSRDRTIHGAPEAAHEIGKILAIGGYVVDISF
jgi:hypothetical protein